jgi:UDP-N-acetylmuramoyl-L-alanyl-D-glutamate--2,6-diaminopimelate ligase
MTSLDPFKLQRLLQIAKAAGCTYVVLEVASHALHQRRFEGIDFDMAVLTNITPEHLDYHKTMEAYVNTKKQLFLQVMKNKKPTKIAVLPKDDDNGRKWAEELYFDKMLSYSINTSSMMR